MPTLKTLVSFNGGDGATPKADLTIDAAGDLFGTTASGGVPGDGTVFEIAKTVGGYATSPTTLVNFDVTNGALPTGGLTPDAAGDLFGTTQNDGPLNDGLAGHGTVFELMNDHAGGYTLETLFSFNGTNGAYPSGDLITDAAGDLFGTTIGGGGTDGSGTVFEVSKTGDSYANAPTTLVSFIHDDGFEPLAGLVADTAGNLFGTTNIGGPNRVGTMFEVAKTSGGYDSTPVVLTYLDSPTDGALPYAGLTIDAMGDLFGTTSQGGPGGDGTVFEIVKTSSGYAGTPITLANFQGTNGAGPKAGLIMDAAGDLFGTTTAGGASGTGTAFEVPKTAVGYGPLTTLVSFSSSGGGGITPEAGLVADAAGDLFGTTAGGGADDGTVFEITESGFVVCYLAGTQIATPTGETGVEWLAVGDMVLTHGGVARPILWIGKGRVLATRGRRNAATPVIVRKGALADNVPHHDLRITKAHSLYIDGVLIPVEFLVNHRSILWDDQAQEMTLYHIELETHDVLLANGASAESYRDDGNRWLFQNANSGWGLAPQEPCAPVLTGGPIVDGIWRGLLERAGPRSGIPMTDDPDLHLLVDGRRVDAASPSDALHVFRLAVRPTTVRISSRTGAPQELGLARDPRHLGVALRQIMVSEGLWVRTMEADDARLADGFHGFEPNDAIRWTDGDAVVPATLFDGFTGPLELALRLGGRNSYVQEADLPRVA